MHSETLYYIGTSVLPQALSLLPERLDSAEARAMVLAIGLQESEFAARVQGGGGPAHGYWQFEKNGGVNGVLTTAGTLAMLRPVLHVLNYPPDVLTCYTAITHNDVLACCFARLLLWTVPGRLPGMHESDKGWHQYRDGWRPGKPRPAAWPQNFEAAWHCVLHE